MVVDTVVPQQIRHVMIRVVLIIVDTVVDLQIRHVIRSVVRIVMDTVVPLQKCKDLGSMMNYLITQMSYQFSKSSTPAPTPTCAPVCEKPCPFGFVLDGNNCPICECKTGCYGNVEPLSSTLNCAKGPRCPSSYLCATTPEGTFGVSHYFTPCPDGSKSDEKDCQTCECLPDGSKFDDKDCQTCECFQERYSFTSCPYSFNFDDNDFRHVNVYQCPGKPTGKAVQRDFPRNPPGTPTENCPVGNPLPGFNCGLIPNPDKCPSGSFCIVDPMDRFGVCCLSR
ncbi:unnamed protein product [Mytilus coruscus]|uniref:Antistasin-like domain-containing protein n=1 Tax=Mytilus coruscus TaxID=42192 RepID=A0A6J8EC16_MYTCO|nr:unnamed protein product [Mytilus coruscus]